MISRYELDQLLALTIVGLATICMSVACFVLAEAWYP